MFLFSVCFPRMFTIITIFLMMVNALSTDNFDDKTPLLASENKQNTDSVKYDHLPFNVSSEAIPDDYHTWITDIVKKEIPFFMKLDVKTKYEIITGLNGLCKIYKRMQDISTMHNLKIKKISHLSREDQKLISKKRKSAFKRMLNFSQTHLKTQKQLDPTIYTMFEMFMASRMLKLKYYKKKELVREFEICLEFYTETLLFVDAELINKNQLLSESLKELISRNFPIIQINSTYM